MVVLHICSLTNNPCSGISQVVPEHYKHQKKYLGDNVAILNCSEHQIALFNGLADVYYYYKIKRNVNNLPLKFAKPDLVVFHGIYFKDYLRIIKQFRFRVTYILVPHGSLTKGAQRIKPIKKWLANRVFFNRLINKATGVQFLSVFEKDNSTAFKCRSFICGNGISEKRIKTYNHKKELKLLYIGRYSIYHKGIDILIDFVKSNEAFFKNNKITVSLFGEGPEDKSVLKETISVLKLDRIVSINDGVFGLDKEACYLQYDMFIQLSRLEGQPLGVMEAMSYGMPVIVTKGTTFYEIVKENGCGIPFDDFTKAIKDISSILSNRNVLEIMGQKAKDYADNNFSWKLIANKSVQMYESIIQSKTNKF